MRNFRALQIWKESINFSVCLYGILDVLPSSEKFGLYSQMTRASVSIPSNIAEGCRGSVKELKHYLNIALGSSFELETQIIIVKKTNMLNDLKCDELVQRLNILQKQINAYRTYISSQQNIAPQAQHPNNPTS
jgi:four helix bundle protein